MRKRGTSAFTIVLWAMLVAAAAAVGILTPRTVDAYRQLQVEQAATPTPTANVASMLLVTPDPNQTPAPTALLMRVGSKGDEVQKLQERLFALEYYNGEIDGQYGQGTADAVKLFQSQNGLDADGMAGEATCALLYSDQAKKLVPTPTPTATPSSLSKGDTGDAVRALQKRLKELGFYTSAIDGDYGGGTQEAVRLFQSQHQLDADGMAGQTTMAMIFSDSAQKLVPTPTPDPNALPVLVNKTHVVDESYRPSDLVNLNSVLPSSLVKVKGSEIEGNRTAAAALQTMLEAAHAEGITTWQISAGYRSYAYQQKLFDNQVAEYVKAGKSKADATAQTKLTVALPGQSEHQTGLAFDITVPGSIFKGTKQQIWLSKNCWDYGFILRYPDDKEKVTGYVGECWHYRYVGAEHATAMRDRGLCLEEYLSALGVS